MEARQKVYSKTENLLEKAHASSLMEVDTKECERITRHLEWAISK